MKRIILFALLFINVKSYAQTDTISSGYYLMAANKQFKQSIIMGVLGSGAVAGGVYAFTEAENPREAGIHYVGIGLGSALLIGSVVAQFKAWHYVGRAGEKMNEKGIGFNPTQNGVGLTYRF